jgi:hypothetical protein
MGRNLISKTTEGIWTKREPKVSYAIPLSSSSKLSESNVGIPYTSKETSPKP